MGSTDRTADNDEQSVHRVSINRPFYLGKYEVTQEQWKKVMGNNPSHFKDCGGDCPVEQVNWWEAVAYANALSTRENRGECYMLDGCKGNSGEGMECKAVTFKGLNCQGYRLPTEAEWEYAARAGSTTAYSFGDDPSELDRYAWYSDSGNSGGRTHPVGQKRPNTWGLYDMHGNVWEWVQDWYGRYPEGPVTDPQGPSSGSYRVCRGGGWINDAGHCRSAARNGCEPGLRYSDLGFRLLRAAP